MNIYSKFYIKGQLLLIQFTQEFIYFTHFVLTPKILQAGPSLSFIAPFEIIITNKHLSINTVCKNLKKNPTYRRQRISQPMRIVAPIPNKSC